MPAVPSGPGFHQSHLRGRASGRLSPRPAIRGPVRERILAAHGLIDQGAADPNQGQLFNPVAEGIPTKSPEQLAREKGVAPPLASSRPGFMPGIERSTPQATRKAKVTAINNLAASRERTGAARGGGAVHEAMQDTNAYYDRGEAADWYQPTLNGRNVMGEGMARRAIDTAALQTGTTNAKMTRATAITSPRTAWDEGGAPGTSDYTMPNIESARNVVRATQKLPDGASQEQIKEAGMTAHGSALNDMKGKAALYHTSVEPTKPIGIADKASQKVPNFEQSLHMSHNDPEIVRQASGSYTVDAWATAAMGGDEKLLKTDTGYAAAHMVGTRAAMKRGELGPNHQARVWNVIRGDATPNSMGNNRLFVSKRNGQVAPNPKAISPLAAETRDLSVPMMTRTQARRRGVSMADKHDLEF